MWRSKFRTCTILLQHYAGNKQQSFEIMKNVNIRNIGQGEAKAWWRSGIRSINCIDCGHILGQYMNNKNDLQYKTWTAGLR